MLIPTSPRHAKLHDKLVSFIRRRAREWRKDPTLTKGEFLKCMASELQVNAALLVMELVQAEERVAFEHYMNGCIMAWQIAQTRNYTGHELITDEAGIVQ